MMFGGGGRLVTRRSRKEARRTVRLVRNGFCSSALSAGGDVLLDVGGNERPPVSSANGLQSLRDSRVSSERVIMKVAKDL